MNNIASAPAPAASRRDAAFWIERIQQNLNLEPLTGSFPDIGVGCCGDCRRGRSLRRYLRLTVCVECLAGRLRAAAKHDPATFARALAEAVIPA